MMEKLLNDELKEKEKIEFYEPDLEFTCILKLICGIQENTHI